MLDGFFFFLRVVKYEGARDLYTPVCLHGHGPGLAFYALGEMDEGRGSLGMT